MNSFLDREGARSNRSNFRMFVIVVAEQSDTGWNAWFRNSPQHICEGSSDILAILTLLEVHGNINMDPWDMTCLDARSRDGHLEFLLPITLGKTACPTA